MKEEKSGILYFFVLVGVLVTIWFFLVTTAINVQQEAAENYVEATQSEN